EILDQQCGNQPVADHGVELGDDAVLALDGLERRALPLAARGFDHLVGRVDLEVVPVARDPAKALGLLGPLLSLALDAARIDALLQRPLDQGALLARIRQRDVGVLPEMQRAFGLRLALWLAGGLVLWRGAAEAVAEPPVLCAFRRDQEIEPAAVRE